jgi:hypothetical protein
MQKSIDKKKLLIIAFFIGISFSLTSIKTSANTWEIPQPQIDIPTVELTDPYPCGDGMCVPWIGDYIAGIYQYAIGIVGIVAALVIMYGGVLWITAGGNASRIDEAKTWMGAALAGLVLALSSYVILYQVNPDLVKRQGIQVKTAKDVPREETDTSELGTAIDVTDENGETRPINEIRDDCLERCGEEMQITGNSVEGFRCVCESEGQEACDGNVVASEPECNELCGRGNHELSVLPTRGDFCCVCNENEAGGHCGTAGGCFAGLYCYDGICRAGESGDPCGTVDCLSGGCECQEGACIGNSCITECENCETYTRNCTRDECEAISPNCVYESRWGADDCTTNP